LLLQQTVMRFFWQELAFLNSKSRNQPLSGC